MLEPFVSLLGALSAAELALLFAAVFLAGFIRGFVGFGAALVIVMCLSVVFGPHVAVPVANLSGLPPTIQLLPAAIRQSERPFVLPFCLGTFFAAPLGAWVLVAIDASLMRMVISGFVLVMVAILYRGWRLSRWPGKPALAGAGAAAGFVQGSAGVSGPMAVAIALSRTGTAHQQRANVIGALTALNLCALVPFWYYGLFTLEVIVISIVIVPPYSLAIWLGARFFGARGHQFFRTAALLLLAAIGLVTMILAVRDYIAAT